MEANEAGRESLQEAEIRGMLTDFAQFALQVNTVTRSAASRSAALLLQRLLLLCAAQRGAIFISTEEQRDAEQQSLFDASGRRMQRIIALHDMSEQEAHMRFSALLPTAMTAASMKRGMIGDNPCWAIYHLPTSAASIDEDEEASRTSTELLIGEAWLLLGWSVEEDGACEALHERAHTLLPLVAVPAGAALLSLLQTERIHELEAATYQRSVNAMELLKAELLATVSHELRSPLASVKGYAATLLRHERRIAAEERHEFLLAIHEASNRLQFIVDRFLEMSELETESVKISPFLIDVARIAQEAIGSAEARATAQRADSFSFRLHLKDAAGQPATSVPLVKADPRLLREVFDNLLENAVNYSPQGGLIEVILRPISTSSPEEQSGLASETKSVTSGEAWALHETQGRSASRKPGAMLEICVRDRGMGIASEHLERVFDRFYRVDTTLTRAVGGLGLGLSINKRIVELHHGTIWAEERPEGGSAFYILLPITRD